MIDEIEASIEQIDVAIQPIASREGSTIGTCSLCGGGVVDGGIAMNYCLGCGAVEDTGLPVLPMRKSTSDIADEVAESLAGWTPNN